MSLPRADAGWLSPSGAAISQAWQKLKVIYDRTRVGRISTEDGPSLIYEWATAQWRRSAFQNTEMVLECIPLGHQSILLVALLACLFTVAALDYERGVDYSKPSHGQLTCSWPLTCSSLSSTKNIWLVIRSAFQKITKRKRIRMYCEFYLRRLFGAHRC